MFVLLQNRLLSFRSRAIGLVRGMTYTAQEHLRRGLTENVCYESTAFQSNFHGVVIWDAVLDFHSEALSETTLGKCDCIGRERWRKTLSSAACRSSYRNLVNTIFSQRIW